MYKCPECGEIFDEPEWETVCLEELYGVSREFGNWHYATYANCPECGEPIDTEMDIYDEEQEEDDE